MSRNAAAQTPQTPQDVDHLNGALAEICLTKLGV